MFRYWGKDDAVAQIKAQPFYAPRSVKGLTIAQVQRALIDIKELQGSFDKAAIDTFARAFDRKEW